MHYFANVFPVFMLVTLLNILSYIIQFDIAAWITNVNVYNSPQACWPGSVVMVSEPEGQLVQFQARIPVSVHIPSPHATSPTAPGAHSSEATGKCFHIFCTPSLLEYTVLYLCLHFPYICVCNQLQYKKLINFDHMVHDLEFNSTPPYVNFVIIDVWNYDYPTM